ncbi:hypothetical protein BDR05DRAFT_989223 [Suillus weaverae]|nr:hypothetical protein BDR05DRAFT_989223 [Suillus weaverae]
MGETESHKDEPDTMSQRANSGPRLPVLLFRVRRLISTQTRPIPRVFGTLVARPVVSSFKLISMVITVLHGILDVDSHKQLLAFRFLTGIGGSAPLSVRFIFNAYKVFDLSDFRLQFWSSSVVDAALQIFAAFVP